MRYYTFHISSKWRLLLLAVACVLCVACASSVGQMVGVGKFNSELLNEGGIVIGGVSAKSSLTLQQRVDYAELLQQVIQQSVPELAIVSPRAVYKSLGQNLYIQMLDSYKFHETGSTAFMNLIHERFPDTRYVVYARIEGDEVEHQKEKFTDGRGYALETIRGFTVSLRVFDLHARQLQVWAAGLQQVEKTERRVFGKYSEYQLEDLYPEPPTTEKVMKKTYSGLVSGLTQAK